ncbi:hypothetical protein [Roseomonas sp. AR75]|uniref:hypothetical protein n=1 Tax=Roseomonas sp. AR75 TaxID=2562311 RepID=UPI0010BF682D|nr:hypothetical protein [Roseomonas sp. AR75]
MTARPLGRRDLAALLGLLLPGCASGTAQAQPQHNRRQARGGRQRTVLRLPASMPCADRPGDLTGLLLEGSGAPSGTVVVFGLPFRPGEIPRGSGLTARLAADGRALPVQLDASRHHPDGSVRYGLVSLAAPALPQGQLAGVVLARGQGGAPAGQALDFASALDGRQVTVELTPKEGGAPWRADLGALLRGGRAEAPWQSGPLATQARIVLPAPLGAVRSMRCIADVAVRADRTIWVDLWLRNDIAMQPGGGDASYTARLTIGEHDALTEDVPRHWQYGAWGRLVGAGARGAAPKPPRVIHDPRYLGTTGATMPFDISVGVDQAVLQRMARAREPETWDPPLSPRGLKTSMGAPGGRPDLGQTTNWNAAWLISGDAEAAEIAIGQAEAAGGIPWHFWDPKGGKDGNGGWLDVKRWPRFWTDRRGGSPPHTLVRAVPNSVWQRGAVPSHQPALSFVPYVLTGRRPFLDNLMAQAGWNVICVWPANRRVEGPADDMLVVRKRQTRSTAWTIRTLSEAAWAASDADPTLPYIEQVTAANWGWMVEQIPRLTEFQGQLHGYIEPLNYGYTPNIAAWQQDYVVSSAAMATLRGREDARQVLDWMRNFIVGRFFATQYGFTRNDAVADRFSLIADPLPEPPSPPKPPLQTWTEVVASNRARDQDNGTGWSHSNGEYIRLGMLSLALIAHAFDDPRAKEAWQWLAKSDSPNVNLGNFLRASFHTVAPPGMALDPEHLPRCAASAPPRR